MARVTGGDKLARHLQGIADKLSTGKTVRVGFLEDARYPADAKGKSLPVATVAYWDNFGTTRSPPRPFFTNMVAAGSPQWGARLAGILKATGYDSAQTLSLMGESIKDELVKSIVDWPADNAPATVARKGFNKGLIDKGVMQRAPAYTVER